MSDDFGTRNYRLHNAFDPINKVIESLGSDPTIVAQVEHLKRSLITANISMAVKDKSEALQGVFNCGPHYLTQSEIADIQYRRSTGNIREVIGRAFVVILDDSGSTRDSGKWAAIAKAATEFVPPDNQASDFNCFAYITHSGEFFCSDHPRRLREAIQSYTPRFCGGCLKDTCAFLRAKIEIPLYSLRLGIFADLCQLTHQGEDKVIRVVKQDLEDKANGDRTSIYFRYFDVPAGAIQA